MMRSRRFIFISVLLFSCARSAFAQQTASPLIVELPQDGHAAFKLNVDPINKRGIVSAPIIEGQVFFGEAGVVHRFIVDQSGAPVFGYDLVIEPLRRTKQFKVFARPLSLASAPTLAEQLRGEKRTHRAADTIQTLTRASATETLSDGDGFTLDLLVNERSGVLISDYIKLSFDRSRLAPPRKQTIPRDFTLGDVELAMKGFRLRVNGELLPVVSAKHDCAGALLWLSVENRGRFIFSLAPREGYDFRKVGAVEGDTISFTWEGARYEWISSQPVLSGGASESAWNLWVMYDADYRYPFAPPAAQTEEAKQPSELEEILTDPARVIRKRTGDPRQTSAQPKSQSSLPRKAQVRVRVGGAKEIESLVTKR